MLTDFIETSFFLTSDYDSIQSEDIKNVWADFRTHCFHLSHLLSVFVHKFDVRNDLKVWKCMIPSVSCPVFPLYLYTWSELFVPLVNMIKEGCENKCALLFLLTFYFFLNLKKSKLSLENNNLKWGKISLWNKCFFFSNTCWTQLLVPLEILMSKIYLKYIPIHIHNFEHTSVIMNMKLSSHGFLLHRNINRRENKGQIPN